MRGQGCILQLQTPPLDNLLILLFLQATQISEQYAALMLDIYHRQSAAENHC
jgi:hypothetical protein